MENLKKLAGQLKQILPKETQEKEKQDSVILEYPFECAGKGLNICIVLKGKFAIIKGTQKYDFQYLEKEQQKFNDKMKNDHKEFQIFGQGQNFSMAKRFTYNNIDSLKEHLTNFEEKAKEILDVYEKDCINFLIKTKEEEKEYDPVKKVDKVNKVTDTQEKMEENKIIHSFREFQIRFCKEIFEAASSGFEIRKEGNTRYFEEPLDKGVLRLNYAEDDKCFKYEYCIRNISSTDAYLMLADIENTYSELSTNYDEDTLHVFKFIIPDPYQENILQETKDLLIKAVETCNIKWEKRAENIDDVKIASDIQKLLEQQMNEIKAKDEELSIKADDLQAREEEFQKKVQSFHAEHENSIQKIKAHQMKLDEREKEIDEKAAKLEEDSRIISTERSKYLLQMKSLTSEISKLKIYSGEKDSGISKEKELMYKSQIEALTKSRAIVEVTLKRELNGERKKNQDLTMLLKEKEEEINEMKNDLHAQAKQLFAEEKAVYENEIKRLKEAADITDHDINIDSFLNHITEKGYDDAKILHGGKQDIVSFHVGEGLEAKVIFGDIKFMDVIKKMERRNIPQKTLDGLNSQNIDIKFFAREGEVVARKIFSKKISNMDLEAQILCLTEFFSK